MVFSGLGLKSPWQECFITSAMWEVSQILL